MPSSRITYFICITLTVVAGLISRHFKIVPLFVGDILWAVMVYFIMRFLFINKSKIFAAVAGLLFCYTIELSQLYSAPWINGLRNTLWGHLILGQGFLWSDMVSYTVGVAAAALADHRKFNFSKSI